MSDRFWVGAIALLLFFPSSLAGYKYALAGLVAMGLLLGLMQGRRYYLHPAIAFGTFASVALGVGLLCYNQYLFPEWRNLREGTLWVLAPLLYTALALLASRRPGFPELLDRALFAATLLIVINSQAYVLFNIIGLPYPLAFLPLDYNFGSDERGFVAYTTNNLPVLAYTVPYMLLSVFLRGRQSRYRLVVLVLAVIASITSLRIAILLNVAFAGLVVLVLWAWKGPLTRVPKVAALVTLVVIPMVLLAPLTSMVERSEAAYGLYQVKLAQKLSGEDQRYRQARSWTRMASERPFLGHGLSAVSLRPVEVAGHEVLVPEGPIANEFGYELTYFMLLVLIGAVPLAIYASLVLALALRLWALARSPKAADEELAVGHALGMLLFLSASSTNGYLLTTGYVWTLFFPLAFLNVVLARRVRFAPERAGPRTIPYAPAPRPIPSASRHSSR